jgi:hypothetical protein
VDKKAMYDHEKTARHWETSGESLAKSAASILVKIRDLKLADRIEARIEWRRQRDLYMESIE